jgi:hypothetical protein
MRQRKRFFFRTNAHRYADSYGNTTAFAVTNAKPNRIANAEPHTRSFSNSYPYTRSKCRYG